MRARMLSLQMLVQIPRLFLTYGAQGVVATQGCGVGQFRVEVGSSQLSFVQLIIPVFRIRMLQLLPIITTILLHFW